MSDLRASSIEVMAIQLALELGHTMASVDPPRAGPNTRRIATAAFDALLSHLTAHQNEHFATSDQFENITLADFVALSGLSGLLAVLEGDRGKETD